MAGMGYGRYGGAGQGNLLAGDHTQTSMEALRGHNMQLQWGLNLISVKMMDEESRCNKGWVVVDRSTHNDKIPFTQINLHHRKGATAARRYIGLAYD